ncbi:hypothetical protein JCM13664_04390 [Methylothermus subterraneus]
MRALAFEPKPSRIERYFLLLGHGLALLAVWLSALPGWGKLLASAGLGVSLWVPRRQKVAKIGYDGERWTLSGPGLAPVHAELLPSTWRSRLLTLLHFRLPDRRFLAVRVFRDSLAEDDYRRLQVVLRWQVDFKR